MFILYVLQAAPIFLQCKIFQCMDSVILTFIWKNSQPKIAKSSLQATIADDSLAALKFYNYFFLPLS